MTQYVRFKDEEHLQKFLKIKEYLERVMGIKLRNIDVFYIIVRDYYEQIIKGKI